MLQTVKDHHLYGKREKYDFWIIEVKFLRHVISQEGISIDPAKIDYVLQWKRSKNVTEVCIFLD